MSHLKSTRHPRGGVRQRIELPRGALLKVSGDKLTLCLVLDPAKAKGKLPEDFTAPAGSDRMLLEFRREK